MDVLSAMSIPVLAASAMYVVVSSVRVVSTADHPTIIHMFTLIFIGAFVYGAMVLLIARNLCHEVLELISRPKPLK